MISAAILTHNDEKRIGKCIKLLNFCSEVIILDDNSTDKTREKAKQLGAKVYQHALNGDFASQRNRLLEKATQDWVLFIDPDEQVTKELANEINNIIKQPKYEVYYLKRQDYFLGKAVRYGEVSTATTKGFIRLVKKGSGKWKGLVHETFVTRKPAGTLENALLHYPHETVTDFIKDINHYSTLRSLELYKARHKATIWEVLFLPLGKFCYTYFWKQGFRDGPPGFIYSFMMSFHSFLVRAKLYKYQYLDSHEDIELVSVTRDD